MYFSCSWRTTMTSVVPQPSVSSSVNGSSPALSHTQFSSTSSWFVRPICLAIWKTPSPSAKTVVNSSFSAPDNANQKANICHAPGVNLRGLFLLGTLATAYYSWTQERSLSASDLFTLGVHTARKVKIVLSVISLRRRGSSQWCVGLKNGTAYHKFYIRFCHIIGARFDWVDK